MVLCVRFWRNSASKFRDQNFVFIKKWRFKDLRGVCFWRNSSSKKSGVCFYQKMALQRWLFLLNQRLFSLTISIPEYHTSTLCDSDCTCRRKFFWYHFQSCLCPEPEGNFYIYRRKLNSTSSHSWQGQSAGIFYLTNTPYRKVWNWEVNKHWTLKMVTW